MENILTVGNRINLKYKDTAMIDLTGVYLGETDRMYIIHKTGRNCNGEAVKLYRTTVLKIDTLSIV